MPGLTSLSSAYASVRSDDGVCGLHHRYIGAAWSCSDHAARPALNSQRASSSRTTPSRALRSQQAVRP